MTPELATCIKVFRRWLELPEDAGSVLFTLAVVAANRAEGDAVWGLLVGGPGWGKTETLMSLKDQPDVHLAATITEAALLSGTPNRDRAKTSKGGLLREVGEFGILLAKDFTSVLTMNRDTRSAVLSALREVYDGSWTRRLGVDGGRMLHWEGKVGMVAGCTPIIDTHHAVMAAMGERFVFYRLPSTDDEAQGRAALAHFGLEKKMRAELAEAAGMALGALDPEHLAAIPSEPDVARLIRLATVAVRCRSAVERDARTREIELILDPEAPGRLALVLLRILKALRALGAEEETAWVIVTRVALDSMPIIRRRVIEALLLIDEIGTPELATIVDYPTSTTRRALEDLAVHGVARRRKKAVKTGKGTGMTDLWRLTEWTRERWPGVVPEKSPHTGMGESKREETQSDLPFTATDFSGTTRCPVCGGNLENSRGDPDCYGCEIGDPWCPTCQRHANYRPVEAEAVSPDGPEIDADVTDDDYYRALAEQEVKP